MRKVKSRWKVKNRDGERYLISPRNEVQISATELRSFLHQLYGTDALTPRQFEIMGFIQEYRESYSVSPTLEEIAEEFGTSKITVYEHLNQLENKGALARKKYCPRSILPLIRI